MIIIWSRWKHRRYTRIGRVGNKLRVGLPVVQQGIKIGGIEYLQGQTFKVLSRDELQRYSLVRYLTPNCERCPILLFSQIGRDGDKLKYFVRNWKIGNWRILQFVTGEYQISDYKNQSYSENKNKKILILKCKNQLRNTWLRWKIVVLWQRWQRNLIKSLHITEVNN